MVRLMKLVALAASGYVVAYSCVANNLLPQSPTGNGISIIPNIADLFATAIASLVRSLGT